MHQAILGVKNSETAIFFLSVRFYLGAGLLVALVSIMWSLPIDADAAADKARDKAADAAATAPGHIFDKDDTVGEKRRKIEEYLRARYKGSGKIKGIDQPVTISTKFKRDGSIDNLVQNKFLDFTENYIIL